MLESAFRGRGVCSRGVSALGGLLWRGLSALGVSTLGGCLLLGGGIPACTEADTPPVDRITDMSKNITWATTSLRLVKMYLKQECIPVGCILSAAVAVSRG